MMKLFRVIMVAAGVCAAGAGCLSSGGPNVRQEVERVQVVRPSGGMTMLDAIARGAKSRDWAIVAKRPGCVSLRLDVRGKHFARVDVDYGDDWFAVRYVDSGNLNYDPSTGEIHRKYIQWVRNLKQAIRLETSNAL